MKDKRTVLVTGATGQQGGAVIQALLNNSHHHHIVGLTRDTESHRAKDLSALGVEMKKGDFEDSERLNQIMKEVDTVFAVTTPFEKGVEHEIEQGITLANAAKNARVGHFIYTSVASANQNTGIPHFDSKYEVEKHIISLGLPHSIIAPAFFMDNFLSPWVTPGLQEGKVKLAMPADRLLHQIAVEDIGKVACNLINRREEVFGERYDLAGDELTGYDCADILSTETGRTVSFEEQDLEEMRYLNLDMYLMFRWFKEVGYSIDIPKLKSQFPDVDFQTFDTWCHKQDWTILKPHLA